MSKIVLTKNQWERISDILGNFGILILGSVVIPAFQDQFNILLIILGLVVAILFWYISIVIARKY